jgi:hypothetical protein
MRPLSAITLSGTRLRDWLTRHAVNPAAATSSRITIGRILRRDFVFG